MFLLFFFFPEYLVSSLPSVYVILVENQWFRTPSSGTYVAAQILFLSVPCIDFGSILFTVVWYRYHTDKTKMGVRHGNKLLLENY